MSQRRFTFRLDRVARVRDAAEREARAEMGRQRRRAEAALERADEAAARSRAAVVQLGDAREPATRVAAERVTASLAVHARTLRTEADAALADAEVATTAWRVARIEAESIARLREQARERFLDEVAKEDEKERDELTMQRFAADPGPGRTSGGSLKTGGKNFR